MAELESREITRIRELLRTHPKGMTIEEISRLLPLNRTSTAKYLNTLLISGQAEMRSYGRAKVFSLSQRVPVSHLISLSSDLILILDRDLVVTHVNDPFLSVLGLDKEDLIGHKIDNTPFSRNFDPSILTAIHTSAEGREMVTEQRA
ncbi:MAG: PAS domain-containing protein, partial [Methanoregulaceae archaeon]|nr:PAS domain-containing protein [Methanoregulaceae archaeon]